jgi:hypothetical protein
MNSYTTRITVAISIAALAAAISLAGVVHDGQVNGPAVPAPAATDPSVPPASEALRKVGDDRKVSEGNVQDMTY